MRPPLSLENSLADRDGIEFFSLFFRRRERLPLSNERRAREGEMCTHAELVSFIIQVTFFWSFLSENAYFRFKLCSFFNTNYKSVLYFFSF